MDGDKLHKPFIFRSVQHKSESIHMFKIIKKSVVEYFPALFDFVNLK
jgi:hypothetical protein